MATETKHHAETNARAWLANIVAMVAALDTAQDADDAERESERACGEIQDSPLSVTVRNGWREIGGESEPEEFQILLSTGGPALRIYGTLGAHCEPEQPELQYQDWGTPWTRLTGVSADEYAALVRFCEQFSFESY
jgi:hypothetical protein